MGKVKIELRGTLESAKERCSKALKACEEEFCRVSSLKQTEVQASSPAPPTITSYEHLRASDLAREGGDRTRLLCTVESTIRWSLHPNETIRSPGVSGPDLSDNYVTSLKKLPGAGKHQAVL